MKYLKLLILCISLCSITSAAENPHGELKYGCETCHTVESFKDMSFDHTLTGYELQNRHQTADCKGCHDISDFSKVKSNCLSCHNDIHQAKMGNDCESCHTTRGWEQFDIQEMHLNTNFPFSGKHALVDCQACHTNMPTEDFSFNTTRCVSCHQSDYLGVVSPNHVNDAFSTDCENCHQMDRWRPALFENHDISFPIFSGEHKNEWDDDCRSCHTNPSDYQSFNCLNCHEHPQTKTDADHAGIGGYVYNSPDCYFCHPQGKADSFQDHDAQFFPIYSGVHNNEWDNCDACHANPTNRLDFTCLTCHLSTETNQSHDGITGYSYNSSDCYLCHPTGEKGQFVDHDPQFFPIYSGTHNNEWNDYTACHTTPIDKTIFTCVTCHTQTESDASHTGISGYVYSSSDCYLCHPTGERGQFVDHDPIYFPIFSGTHNNEWSDCNECHTNPADRTQVSCITCHTQTESNNMHGSMNGYSYDSPSCLNCHPTGNKGTYTAHDADFFPIFSGAHNNEWNNCETCHTTPASRLTFSCFACHSQSKMDDKHLGEVNGYAYDSNLCYSCHPNGKN